DVLDACRRELVELPPDAVVLHPLGVPAGAQRDGERLLRPVATQARAQLAGLLRFEPDRMEAVAPFDRTPGRGLAATAHPDRDRMRGLRQQAHLCELEV